MTTKDEALRVAREALTKARSCVDATVSKEHAAWAHELDAALRAIALAVEGSADGGSSQEASTCPHGVPHRWPCDQCDSPAVQSVALGDPSAERAAWLADKIIVYGGYAKEAAQVLRRWPAASLRIAGADGATSNGQENGNG